MTSEEQDATVGRVIRESRAAEDELRRLLIRTDQRACDLQQLVTEVSERIKRARTATSTNTPQSAMRSSFVENADRGIEFGRLNGFADAVNLDTIDSLDREIGEAVAKVLKYREQRRQLGVNDMGGDGAAK